MSMPVQIISAFIATAAFAIFMSAPHKYIFWCGLLGAGCWFIYLLVQPRGIIFATFCSTVFVAFGSHILARVLKSPVTVFLIPSIITLVPGAYLYRSVYQVFRNDRPKAVQQLVMTLKIAAAIAVAIFITDSLFILVKRAAHTKKTSSHKE